jgi:colanic acid/amylovoran biosynthesis glycosyltransferase
MNDTARTPLALAYLVSQYPAASHTFILREVRRLRGLGIRIDVASINSPDRPAESLAEEEREEAATTYYVKADGVRGALRAHWATLRARPGTYAKGLLFALRLGGSDIRKLLYSLFYFVEAVMIGHWLTGRALGHLHVHFATPAATVGLIAGRIFPIGFSMSVHGPDEFYDAPGYRLTEKIAGCRLHLLHRLLLSQSAHEALAARALVQARDRPARGRPERLQPAALSRASVALSRSCASGVWSRPKGSISSSMRSRPWCATAHDVRLRLVGGGPDRASLETQVHRLGLGDRVVFEGVVNQDRIRAIYAEADCFALASFAEGIPVVLMEAMAMEIPCVTTFITGHPELIRDGVDGVLVAPSDETALAEAIAGLIADPERRRRLGEAGRRRVIEKYDLETNTRRLADILRRRLGETT